MTDAITELNTQPHSKKKYTVTIEIDSDTADKLMELFPHAKDLETALTLYLKYSLGGV